MARATYPTPVSISVGTGFFVVPTRLHVCVCLFARVLFAPGISGFRAELSFRLQPGIRSGGGRFTPHRVRNNRHGSDWYDNTPLFYIMDYGNFPFFAAHKKAAVGLNPGGFILYCQKKIIHVMGKRIFMVILVSIIKITN